MTLHFLSWDTVTHQSQLAKPCHFLDRLCEEVPTPLVDVISFLEQLCIHRVLKNTRLRHSIPFSAFRGFKRIQTPAVPMLLSLCCSKIVLVGTQIGDSPVDGVPAHLNTKFNFFKRVRLATARAREEMQWESRQLLAFPW